MVQIHVRVRILGLGLYTRVLGPEAWAWPMGLDLPGPF